MARENQPFVTRRAYTLRLRGVINPKDTSWRDALWATHEAVNKGAKAFGDWLLTHIVEQPATNSVMGGGDRG